MLPASHKDEAELEVPPHPCHQQAASSSSPEDGRNYRPKHVELIVIINKKFVIFASSWLFILLYYKDNFYYFILSL